ncbi:PIN domain-containing protein [Dyadobacter fanqingshengii]|uniref:PIN domain-containing protein n=1 Tax=Dyadobacter fanqingshengii TaxID=2906443 RepID=A0A9X1T8X1_9BACT|nr:PIN domain-containing protein [Dyadobacter fanqingshengii]MCF0039334.1 PIN domain-containing protein [Dyadobacter fanqingshengii]USJ33851.1 PIN domain-containing protein [Dyadobacter fanqingshengii]
MSKVALDTNILIYLYDFSDEKKRHISELLLAVRPAISAQVISEYLNVTKRLQKLPKLEVLEKCVKLLAFCDIIPLNVKTMEKALLLLRKHDFQMFDSIIIASALEANCSILYSEDLQHNQLIENKLTIVNPFI